MVGLNHNIYSNNIVKKMHPSILISWNFKDKPERSLFNYSISEKTRKDTNKNVQPKIQPDHDIYTYQTFI